MDILTNKQYEQFDYTARYTSVPFYYNTEDKRSIFGLCTNMNTNTAWVAHKVKETDTLDALALHYYNNPTLWWAIAYFNNIQDPFITLKDHYTMIKIPSISSISFDMER